MTLKKFTRSLLLLSAFITIPAFGQVMEKEYNSYTPVSPTTLSDLLSRPSGITVYDSEAGKPNQVDAEPNSYVSLRIDNNIAPFEWYEVKIKLLITPLMANGTLDTPVEKEFKVNYNPNSVSSGAGTNFSDFNYLKIENRYGLNVKAVASSLTVKRLDGSSIALPVNNVFLNFGFKVKRYYEVSEQLISPGIVVNGSTTALTLNWPAFQGAQEYEVEWTWVDGYLENNLSGLKPENQILFSERDFELNNTRISTPNLSYEIPLIYSKGYLIYRIRAIGNDKVYKTLRKYSFWSSGSNVKVNVSDWPHKYAIALEHEEGKNWQFQASYAEQGKKKEVVSYFDGSLRNRQTVTKVNTTNNTVIGEVIYDAQGRAAIEILPTPSLDSNIHYFKNHNLNLNNTSYSYKDFDLDAGSCVSPTAGMSSSSGASKYYSPNGLNDFSSKVNQAYVPDAKLFPFSQTEFTPDNTGRIVRKSGVGPDHQLGTKHEMKYFYTKPTPKELHRLFGYSVGDAIHYKKNIVVDPNGQVSTSYIDPSGKTIATALTGKKPDQMERLLEENTANPDNDHNSVILDILTPSTNLLQSTGIYSGSYDKLSIAEPVIVTSDATGYEFKYDLNQTSSFSPFFCPTGLYPFQYDVKLSLMDDCGAEKLNNPIKTSSTPPNVGPTPVGTYSLAGNHIPAVIAGHTAQATLNTGSYILTKEIKVNEQTLNAYADHYIEKLKDSTSLCFQDPAELFAPNTQLELDTCNLTCSACLTAIGTRNTYVQEAFNRFYGSVAVTVTLPNQNSATIATLIAGSNDISGNPISASEVEALNIRFNREWQLLYQECDIICNPYIIHFEANCTITEDLLIGDLRPNGQYGATDSTIIDSNGNTIPNPNFDKLSVFNAQNNLFHYNTTTTVATTTGNSWKKPIFDYKDEFGVKSLVEVEVVEGSNPVQYNPKIDAGVTPAAGSDSDGRPILTVEPEQLLDVKDFVNRWRDSWALSLLEYHPEYQYLKYSKDICARTKTFQINKVVNNVPSLVEVQLSSDGYDSYMMNTATYADAKSKGFIDFESGDTGKLKIYANDPYFKAVQSQYEDTVLYNARVGTNSIMEHAIKTSYIGDGTPANNRTMYQIAVQGATCNPFSTCNTPHTFNINSLSTNEEKDEVWRIYRSLYVGLKNKIKHVFINIHALKNKSYNGCIGTGNTGPVTNVLGNNFPQKATLLPYAQVSTAGSLCQSTSAGFYATKQKLFLPADGGYDSSIDPLQAINNAVQGNHFEYYAQTGNCPLLFDFDMLLNGFFKDTRFTGQKTALTDVAFNRQYITKELMKKLMVPASGQTVEGLFASGLKPLTISTSVTGSTLLIGFKPTPAGDFTTCPIKITLPAGTSNNWGSYGSTWKIINLKQFYYDLVNSNAAAGVFKYQVVAQIGSAINNPTNIVSGEMLLSGETCAPIGECGIAPGSIGEVLDPNSATNDAGVGCNKKYKFEKALAGLLNDLKSRGQLNSTTPVNLSTYATFTNSYLTEYIQELAPNNTSPVTWTSVYPLSENNTYRNAYYLDKGTLRISIVHDAATLAESASLRNPNNKFVAVTMVPPIITPNGITEQKSILRLVDNDNSTPLANGTAYDIQAYIRYSPVATDGGAYTYLRFECCPVVDPWANDIDHDGVANNLDNCPTTPNTNQLDINPANGVGDVCETGVNSCSVSAQAESDYEQKLKVLYNYLISSLPSCNNCDYYGNAQIQNFVANTNTIGRLQSIRNELNLIYPDGYTRPVEFQTFYAQFTNSALTVSFFNQNTFEASFAMLDFDTTPVINSIQEIINLDFTNIPGKVAVKYYDLNHVIQEKTFSFTLTTAIKQGAAAGLDLCPFLNGHYNNNQSRTFNSTVLDSKAIIDNGQNLKISECSTCIPQTMVPVTCDDKKAAFILAMNAIDIADYTVPQATLDYFCDNGYQYISESYVEYLTKLEVQQLYNPATQLNDVRFRTLAEFGDTYLHYGFNGISSVIDQYKTYYTQNVNNPDILNWNAWVETVFRPANVGKICPPAKLNTVVSEDVPPDEVDNCEHMITNIGEAFSQDNYNNYLFAKRKEFIENYIKQAMSTVHEKLTMTYFDQEYQYTLYYYDQAGNLTQTVAPQGVKRFTKAEIDNLDPSINDYKSVSGPTATGVVEDPSLQPEHKFKTQYRYNSLNQLVWQSTPDGGITRFAYDDLGRIIASENAKQLNRNKMSYTLYDGLGRIEEAGEIDSFYSNAVISEMRKPGRPPSNTTTIKYSISNTGRLIKYVEVSGMRGTETVVNGFDVAGLIKTEVTKTIYDIDPGVEDQVLASSLFETNTPDEVLLNNRNRVAGVYYYQLYNAASPYEFENAIFYNYDIHGNVKELATYIPSLKSANCDENVIIDPATGTKNDCKTHIKRILYDYDLISGNVNHVTYQPKKADQFIHKYEYDADNRIVSVRTSSDGIIWEKDAQYEYYPHGPLSRVELGDKKIQGIDYAYTLQGWLKMVNGENISSISSTMAPDGILTPVSGKTVNTTDAFGYSLNYYNNAQSQDYKAIGVDVGDQSFKPLMYSRNNAYGANTRDLFNGNIKQMVTAIRKAQNELLPVQKNNYTYDQLNRIASMNSVAYNPNDLNAVPATSISSSYTYDRNGNLKTLNRTGLLPNGTPAQMDNLVYDYDLDNPAGNNKLTLVKDTAPLSSSSLFPDDLENQVKQLQDAGITYDINNPSTHNYIYDEIGQLIEDKTEKLKIEWRVDGKVSRVINNKNGTVIAFEYDGLGNRIGKRVQKLNNVQRTHYSRDAQGNVLAVYDEQYKSRENLENDLYLNFYDVNNTEIKRAVNNIYVATDGSVSTVASTGNLTLQASNSIVFYPGFTAVLGSNLSAQIVPVNPVSNESAFVLKEHHIYGSSRLGIQENNLPLYKYTNASETYKTAQASLPLSKTVLTNTSVFSSIPVIRDYSLFLGLNSPSTWAMQNAGVPAVDPLLTNLSLQTNIKLKNAATLGNAEFGITQLQYKGTKSGIIDEYQKIPLTAWTTFTENNGPVYGCIQMDADGEYTVRSLTKNCSVYTETMHYKHANAIPANEEGYVTYKLSTADKAHNIVVMLEIGSEFYSLGTYNVSEEIFVSANYHDGSPEVLPSGDNPTFKIERKSDKIIYSVNGYIIRTVPAQSFNQVANLKIILGSMPSNKKQEITDLSVYRGINGTREITNQIDLSLLKSASGYLPKMKVTQYSRNTATNVTNKRTYSIAGASNLSAAQIASGVDININAALSDGTGSMSINGANQALATTWVQNGTVTVGSIPTVPANGANQIGGVFSALQSAEFDMCYLSYGINNVTDSFTFDDAYSLANTTNPPVTAAGIIMNNNVVRNLAPCLPDTDSDGVFDLYEVNQNDLSFIDTDGDGIANHEDQDDDGDGIYTVNEFSNPDGNKNPTDARDYDSDGKKDYLDADDDNDGYATWETLEGGQGYVNAPIINNGVAYTLNTDNPADAIPNYLDPTNGNFQTTGTISFNYFSNLVGDKRYELSNHLGNVLVVVSDKKIPSFAANGTTLNSFNSDIISYSDYYPFGSLVPNRHKSYDDYRYGFNGMEKDDELKGEGNSYDFEARIFDPRVGRWFARDPFESKYPDVSPYAYCNDNPINLTDPTGKEPEPDPRVWFWWRKMLIGTYAHLELKSMSLTFPVRNEGERWNAEVPIPLSGRADLTFTDFGGNVSIWELKPSTWEHNPQLQNIVNKQINRYVNGMVADKIANGETNFRVSTGTSNGSPLPFIGTITAPVTDGIYDYTATYYISDPTSGIIYYSLSNGTLKPEMEAAKELVKTTVAVIAVTGVVVAGIAAIPATGGVSTQGAYVAAALILSTTMLANEPLSNPQPIIPNNTQSKPKEFKTEESNKFENISIPAVGTGEEQKGKTEN